MGTNALDNLAANGIIGFDADAYVKGTTPRYVGNPYKEYRGLPFEEPLPIMPAQHGISGGPKLGGEPEKDAFISHEEPKSNHTSLKSMIAGITVAGLGIYLLTKTNKIKEFLKFGKTAKSTSNKSFFERCKDKVNSWFSSTPKKATASQVEPQVEKKIEVEAGKTLKKSFFKRKWVKVTGGIGLGLVALYGAFRLIAGHKRAQGMPQVPQGVPIGTSISQPPEVAQQNETSPAETTTEAETTAPEEAPAE